MTAIRKRFLRTSLVAAVLAVAAVAQAADVVDEVDPTIGGEGVLLVPTRPTVSLPNSMVRVYPIRKDQTDDRIASFPLSIISHRLGELFLIMPGDGAATAAEKQPWDAPQAYDQEKTTPYYYRTRFDDSLIATEFAPAARSGYFRFTVPSGKPVVRLADRQGGELKDAGDGAVSGVERFHGMQAYVYGRFDAPVRIESEAGGRRLTVAAADGTKSLGFRYGISYISVEQARKNLDAEIPGWDFDAVKARARDQWQAALGRITVNGGTPAQRRMFYTALYRCRERMVCITEDGQYYSAFDHTVHRDDRPFYVDNWLWDTYRALQPLTTLLDPDAEADKIQSYVRMYQQLGWMPSFAVLWGNHECMTGNPAAVWFADALAKGVTGFDVKTAYEGVKKNSVEGTWLPWRRGPKCELDDFLAKNGYMPALHPGETETVARVNRGERRQAISVTEAQSYDDWCTAQLARAAGDDDGHRFFLCRATHYRNLYRPDKGHVWPKDDKGRWIDGYTPGFSGGAGGRDYTTENNGYTYDWDVQHDLAGLFDLMGGRAAAEAKLDQLFRQDLGRGKHEFWNTFPDATGLVGQFSMGNEPSLHIPYLYNYLGSPWKTQKRVRLLLEQTFDDSILGIPGDEDGGGLSAFVVFSMMGLYPVTPGVPVYNVTSPVFDDVTIALPGGKTFRITAANNSKDNKYIQNLRLNGRPLDRVWLRHADVANGGTLELVLGDTPNRQLGADPATFPPSAISVDPKAFEAPPGGGDGGRGD
jgi:predicted alpha-1,2-mannosidase